METIRRASFSTQARDPYGVAHGLLHWASRFGRVVERTNRLFTTGPRTSLEVKFYVERELDKFAHLHIAFDISGEVEPPSLSTTIEAVLECSLPTPQGAATSTFNELYLARLWPAYLHHANQLASEIVGAAQRQLAAGKVK